LTQCTVKYTLKSILEKVEKGEMSSLELLDLKLLEPAMGAAAFHNELINQLSEAYLNFRQKEVKKKISPEKYREELQRVKAYIATNNTYGVDLNPTAIELGKLSLWLNVIHKDMETPFFANRLAVGNAVVGAWFKTFTTKELKKKWWDCEPQMVSFENGKINRSKNQIYHFLLPDQNMVPSAGIKLLKDEDPDRSKRVSDWKLKVCKPISETEIQQLQKICESIDSLVLEYFEFQKRLNLQTKNKLDVWEGVAREERDSLNQVTLNLRSYDEKEQLNDQRNRQSAPYYKLKMVMDYWCSLWFWDMRNAEFLPSRQQYLNDVSSILNVNLSSDSSEQLGFGFEESTLGVAQTQIIQKTEQSDLFDKKERLSLVKNLSIQNRFFHSQLEFIEVFLERGGFDVIVGNPPWVKVTFEEKGLMSDFIPEILIRKEKAPVIAKRRVAFLDNQYQKNLYQEEFITMESLGSFMNGFQNYDVLKGQQTDLYRSIIVNTLNLVSNNGYIGLVHPESIYDDPKGKPLRKFIFPRLKYHFQFKNELKLFDIHHENIYSLNVYGTESSKIKFHSIHNLFHPSTIDTSFTHNGTGKTGGIKLKSDSGKYIWNTQPHKSRVIDFNEDVLKLIGKTFENSEDWETAKLVSIHSTEILNVLKKLSENKGVVSDQKVKITVCWDETNDIGKRIVRSTQTPNIEDYELILNGPHFFVSNPLYKTPRSVCEKNQDFDNILLTKVNDNFTQRTNYIPTGDLADFINANSSVRDDIKWIDDYRVVMSKMISLTGERSLQPCIIPPKVSHVNGVISVQFENWKDLTVFTGLTSSLVLDFFVKSIGAANLTDGKIKYFPFVIDQRYKDQLIPRVLLLNCINNRYLPLWNELMSDYDFEWSIKDNRLSRVDFKSLDWESAFLKNLFERRWALIEIDVLSSMALGLSLDELTMIYDVQFPVLQSYEDSTFYDQKGNLVFTNNSQGLRGLGISSNEFKSVSNMKKGETYHGSVIENEFYGNRKIDFFAPFEKRNRIEDYKVAWAHFEKILNQN
jgi:hypothetical protein